MTLSQAAVRAAAGLVLALVSPVAIWAGANVAEASSARDAMDEAKVDLAARPPRREAARAALQRSIQAGDDPTGLAEAYVRLATLDEEDGEFARAVERDQAAVAAAPLSRWARTAGARISWLGARSEGGFAPLVRLTHVWSDPAIGGDAGALEALAREVDSFPPGTVRGEARMFIAEAWLRRLYRADDAKRELVEVRDDPSAGSQSVLFAERDLAEELLAEGRLDESETEVRTRGAQLEPSFVARVRQLVRRRTVSRVAVCDLVAFGALSAAALVLAKHRAAGPPARRLRRLRWAAFVVFGAVSIAAAAFVVFDAVRPSVLDRFGL